MRAALIGAALEMKSSLNQKEPVGARRIIRDFAEIRRRRVEVRDVELRAVQGVQCVQPNLEIHALANLKFAAKHRAEVFLVPLGELAAKKSLKLFTELWNHDIVASEFS
jgi:hypothetical protein